MGKIHSSIIYFLQILFKVREKIGQNWTLCLEDDFTISKYITICKCNNFDTNVLKKTLKRDIDFVNVCPDLFFSIVFFAEDLEFRISHDDPNLFSFTFLCRL